MAYSGLNDLKTGCVMTLEAVNDLWKHLADYLSGRQVE